MIKTKTKLERLQWEHQKLQRVKADLQSVRWSFEERDLKQSQLYDDISHVIIRVENLMWTVETDVRFEIRLTEVMGDLDLG